MASHGASVGRAAKAGEGKVGDGVNARTPVGYDSTGFLFLVSAFSLRGIGPALLFCLVALGDGSVMLHNGVAYLMPRLFRDVGSLSRGC